MKKLSNTEADKKKCVAYNSLKEENFYHRDSWRNIIAKIY